MLAIERNTRKKEQKLLNCYSLFLVKMKEATAATVRINPLNEHHCNNPHATRKLQTFSLWWLFNLMGLVCKLWRAIALWGNMLYPSLQCKSQPCVWSGALFDLLINGLETPARKLISGCTCSGMMLGWRTGPGTVCSYSIRKLGQTPRIGGMNVNICIKGRKILCKSTLASKPFCSRTSSSLSFQIRMNSCNVFVKLTSALHLEAFYITK